MDEILQKAGMDVLLTILTLLTTVVIPYGAVLVRSYFKAKIEKIQSQQLRDGVTWAFERLDQTAQTTVAEIEMLLRKRLGKRTADGSEITHATLATTAVNRIYKRLPAQALVTLEQQYGDRESIDRLIRAKVESKVWQAK
jgi:hypothetical protein